MTCNNDCLNCTLPDCNQHRTNLDYFISKTVNAVCVTTLQQNRRKWKKTWRDKNKEKVREQSRAYYEANKKSIREKRNATNKERNYVDIKLYRKKTNCASDKKWREKNKDEINRKARERYAEKKAKACAIEIV